MTKVQFLSAEDKETLVNYLSNYLHGGCFIFALAMHRSFGLPLVCIDDGKRIIHAAVQVDENTYRDARGDTATHEFVVVFNAHHDKIRPTSEAELKAISFEANKEELSDKLVENCIRKAESVWPEWPWRNSNLEKLRNFTNELEALCRKHGFWIQEAYPTTAPIVYPEFGGEEGYLLEQLPSFNNQFFLRRTLK